MLCRRSAAISPIKVASPTLDAGGEVGPPASKEASIVEVAAHGGACVSPGSGEGQGLPAKAAAVKTNIKVPEILIRFKSFMFSP